jgi:hypothetical protein
MPRLPHHTTPLFIGVPFNSNSGSPQPAGGDETPPSGGNDLPSSKKSSTGDWVHPPGGDPPFRPPVPVNFGGTRFPAGKDNPAVADHNRRVLEQAIFVLSQSPTGRDLLQRITAAGYTLCFDNNLTDSRGAGGLCDGVQKAIILHGQGNPEYLAVLIGHEAVHAMQNTTHELFPSSDHRPEEGIKLSFAIEADAYAQQTQIALELFYGDPQAPAGHQRFEQPLIQMRRRFPDIVRAAERAMIDDRALQDGRTVTAAFEAFYDNQDLRTFYEDSHIIWAEGVVPRDGRTTLRRHFNQAADPDWIKKSLRHRGKPYLMQHAKKMNLSDKRYSGVSEKTARRIEKFYREHLRREPPVLKIFGYHMDDAAGRIFGRGSGTGGRVLGVFRRKSGRGGRPPDGDSGNDNTPLAAFKVNP